MVLDSDFITVLLILFLFSKNSHASYMKLMGLLRDKFKAFRKRKSAKNLRCQKSCPK